jgi:hypothetical protein
MKRGDLPMGQRRPFPLLRLGDFEHGHGIFQPYNLAPAVVHKHAKRFSDIENAVAFLRSNGAVEDGSRPLRNLLSSLGESDTHRRSDSEVLTLIAQRLCSGRIYVIPMSHSTPSIIDIPDFASRIMAARDGAADLVAKRLPELRRWNENDRTRAMLWFGQADEATRNKLTHGLTRAESVLRSLTPEHFVEYTDANVVALGCGGPRSPNAIAAVCPVDERHRIMLANNFFSLPFQSDIVSSQTGTLIHEVTHFNDVLGTRDITYAFHQTKHLASTSPHLALRNADNVAGYIMSIVSGVGLL